MSYVKNCSPGKITMDLPRANYVYELPLLSIGDIHGPFNLSLIFSRTMAVNNLNPFDMAAGYKLNVHKVLNFGNPNFTYILETNGKRTEFNQYQNNGLYAFSDDSQRIMRTVTTNPNTYEIEYPDFTRERYNQDGYITSVTDKYGVEVLSYSYDGSKLTKVTYRGKEIQFSYSGGTMNGVRYNGTTYNTILSLGTASATVQHYSGMNYVLAYTSDDQFRAYSTESFASTSICREVKVVKSATNTFEITELIGSNEVNVTTHKFPASVSNPDTAFSQVEITNNEGVKTRVQYQFGKPLYSYEITGSDAAFDSAKYLGTVKIYNTVDSLLAGQTASSLTINDGLQMLYTSGDGKWNYEIRNFTGGDVNGYFVLTGWVRNKSTSATLDNTKLHISTGSNNFAFYPRIVCDTKWKFFAYKFYTGNMEGSFLSVWPESSNSVELKDLRLMFQATDFLKEDDKSRVVMSEDVLITSGGNVIPIRGSAFTCGDETIICREFHETIDLYGNNDCVTFEDLLRYKVNQLKGTNTAEFYSNRGKNVIVSSSAGSATVTHDGVTYYLSNCKLGRRTFTGPGTVTTRVLEDDDRGFLVYETVDTNGTDTLTCQILNEYLDVVQKIEYDHSEEQVKTVTTTYTRDRDLVTGEAVAGLYARETAYDTDTAGNTTVTVTDEYNAKTIYTLDPIWGAVISIKLPNGELVTDTYDDDMCALTKRIYGKTGSTTNRSHSLAYSNGNISAMSTGSLNYAFTYLGDKLTKITKNAALIEMHSHSDPEESNDYCSTINSHYPSAANPMHSVTASFDKYGRLITIDGVVTNTYDLWPSFNATTGALIPSVDNGSAHLAMTVDEITGQTARYDYNTRGLLEEQTVTDKSNFATKISSEKFTYDERGRLATHTATYDIAGNQSVGEAITYSIKTDSASANNAIKTYNYKVNGVSKSITENTFDEYNRLKEKTVKFAAKALIKTIGYTATRATRVYDMIADANVGMNTYSYDAFDRIVTDSYSSDKSDSDFKKYTYDQYGQLIRENNLGLAKTYVYEYNDIGNITSVKAYNYTLNTTPSGTPTTTNFGYTNDKLTSFGGSSIAYNAMGCPTSYDGKSATWTKGKLTRLGSGTLASGTKSYTYNYNAFGQRVSKAYSYLQGTSGINQMLTGEVTAYSKKYYYDHAGRLMAETTTKTLYSLGTSTERIVYLYDESGMVGMEYTAGSTSTLYYFQRNLQGDVTAIVDTNGNIIARYLYDAWGNCTISGETTNYAVAHANPIRYRGYYYDEDTGLYYCNARYYSPKWRRFISPDDTAYLDPESVNGLNLYCYCGNDPINYVDPSGHFAISAALFVGSIVIGALFGGGAAAYSSIKNGDEWYEVALKTISGAALGGMLGAAMGTGAALAAGGTIAGLSVGASVTVGMGITVGGSAVLGATNSLVNQTIDNDWDVNKVNVSKIGSDALVAGIKGLLSFVSGAWTGAAGLWNIPKGAAPGPLNFGTKIILNAIIGNGWKLSVDAIYAMILGEKCGWINGLKTVADFLF